MGVETLVVCSMLLHCRRLFFGVRFDGVFSFFFVSYCDYNTVNPRQDLTTLPNTLSKSSLRLHVPMELWRSKALPPHLTIPHQRQYWYIEKQQNQRECYPAPVMSNPLCERQSKETNNEREAASQIH